MFGLVNATFSLPDFAFYSCSLCILRDQKSLLTEYPNDIFQCQVLTVLIMWLHCLLPVIVDTNQWYHATKVLPGDLSITIGAEYD